VSWLLAGRPVGSVLLSRLRYLGDVAMTTVAAEALRRGDPDLRIGYLCESAHGIILAHHPYIDQVHLLAVKRRGHDARARGKRRAASSAECGSAECGPATGTAKMVGELRRARYDVAFDLFFNPRSAWLLWLSGIRTRVGGSTSWRRRLYTHTVVRDDVADHAGFAAVAPGGLGEHLCRLLPLTHAESGLGFAQWLAENFSEGELKPLLRVSAIRRPTRPYIVLAPGATWATKEWSAVSWRQLLACLVEETGADIRILIPPGDERKWTFTRLEKWQGRVQVLPPQSLPEVKDVLAAAAGLVTVDGGVMHTAVALGTPTVALFGPTDPAIWFPYEKMGPFVVLHAAPSCAPCDRHVCPEFICMPQLGVNEVVAAVRELFGRNAIASVSFKQTGQSNGGGSE